MSQDGSVTEWLAVGEYVRARREELGLTQAQLAQAAGISETTIRVLETARRTTYRRSNLRSIARALGWPDDAIDRIRAGRPPDEPLVERDDRSLEERIDAIQAELTALRDELRARQRV